MSEREDPQVRKRGVIQPSPERSAKTSETTTEATSSSLIDAERNFNATRRLRRFWHAHPLAQNHETGMTLYVRTSGSPASLVAQASDA